jgi:hypothetical protein
MARKNDPRATGITFAIITFMLGLLIVLRARRDLRRRRRVRDTPTSRIADIGAAGTVEISGTVVPSEEGALTAPFSGRPVVWYEARGRPAGRRRAPQRVDDACRSRARRQPGLRREGRLDPPVRVLRAHHPGGRDLEGLLKSALHATPGWLQSEPDPENCR